MDKHSYDTSNHVVYACVPWDGSLNKKYLVRKLT